MFSIGSIKRSHVNINIDFEYGSIPVKMLIDTGGSGSIWLIERPDLNIKRKLVRIT